MQEQNMPPEKNQATDLQKEKQAFGRLSTIRDEIDGLDGEILKLLNRRATLSKEVGQIKKNASELVFKPLRERDLLDKLTRENPGPLPNQHLAAIWREILSSSRALQRPQKVAYLGPEGTFSHFAGLEYLGHSASFHPCRDILQIFEEVCQGTCELGVVPLENSLQGTVGVSFDLFLKHEVIIEAELYSRISHCLLSNEENFQDISKVYSHPQPLAQCQGWLRSNLPNATLIPAESTAAAAKCAVSEPHSAAIGNCKLSNIHGLEILARRIEDEPGNWTRFVIIALANNKNDVQPRPTPGGNSGADKTSVLFTVPDKPGSLSNILELFAKHNVNMRKLESRPMRGQPWKYVFFADVESDLNDPMHGKLLEDLGHACNSFRILGCYPTGPQLDRVNLDEQSKIDLEGI